MRNEKPLPNGRYATTISHVMTLTTLSHLEYLELAYYDEKFIKIYFPVTSPNNCRLAII